MQEAYVKLEQVTKVYHVGEVDIHAVDGIDFEVQKGEFVVIVGPSGAGKTTVLNILGGMDTASTGRVFVDGKDIAKYSPRKLTGYRRDDIGFVFQFYNLIPNLTALENVELASQICKNPLNAKRVMQEVGLDPTYIDRYPHEFSGGQRQRIVIARALATRPELLFCDEAVSALDVSVRAQILNLLQDLQDELKLTYLFCSHDLSVIEHICDRVAIMYLGKIVEIGTREDIFKHPKHPYTKALLSAIPMVGKKKERILLNGDIPSPVNPPSGCRFRTRCPYATDRCRQEAPELLCVSGEHKVACFLLEKPEPEQP